jgi:uncharacterized protein DUF4375
MAISDRQTSVLEARAGFRLCSMSDALGPPCLSTIVRRLHDAMVDLRTRTPPKKLEEILAIPDSFEFLVALADLAIPPGTNFHPPPERRHELRQMISTLNGFSLYAGNDGIWKWLIEDGKAHWFAKLQAWLERIGAKRARAYIDAAASVFPHGRIPADDDTRADFLFESAVAAKLREVDRAYKDGFDEIAECLRAYVRQHFELFRKELEDEKNRVV